MGMGARIGTLEACELVSFFDQELSAVRKRLCFVKEQAL